jgi:hypothetical protein
MSPKTLIAPELKRVLAPPFAWVDRHYLFDGFLSALSQHENLLYFFLVLAADRDGLSYYSYDKICTLLKLDVDDYIKARDSLTRKHLIAFDGRQFQVLTLPQIWPRIKKEQRRTMSDSKDNEAQALAEIFAQLTHQTNTTSSREARDNPKTPVERSDKKFST